MLIFGILGAAGYYGYTKFLSGAPEGSAASASGKAGSDTAVQKDVSAAKSTASGGDSGSAAQDAAATAPAKPPAKPKVVQKHVDWPSLTLSGVVGKGVQGAATLNGQIVAVGETISGVEVIYIDEKSVRLKCEHETRNLKVGQSTN